MVADELDRLIKKASWLEENIHDMESVIAGLQKELDALYQDDIPSVLHENGLSSAPLADGRTVVIDQICNVKQGDKPALGKWLEANGYDAVIRTSLEFPKGSDTSEAERLLQETGVDYVKDTYIHPMTLKKVMKDHITGGGNYPPEEAAVVTMFERAKIKGGKE